MSSQRRSVQAPSAVVMIRPRHFSPNEETASDNAFQQSALGLDREAIAQDAYDEVTQVSSTLHAEGIRTHIFDDETGKTPDSVFPNNWFSTHPGGHVAVFPMFARNRRRERRVDVIEMLKRDYRVQDVIDYSGLEADGLYLEGTGAMVLDHIDRVAYAIRSNRADPVTLERFCTHFNYEPMVFDARDAKGTAVYHTNVLMCMATEFAMISLDMVADEARRRALAARIEQSGRTVIDLNEQQITEFAGNAIELQGRNGRVLALSSRALRALRPEQIDIIEQSAGLLPLDVPTVEMAGGSVRCMLAGIHLSSR